MPCAGAGFGSEALQQLVLIVADGRGFHEKAALQRAVREVRAMTDTCCLCCCLWHIYGWGLLHSQSHQLGRLQCVLRCIL